MKGQILIPVITVYKLTTTMELIVYQITLIKISKLIVKLGKKKLCHINPKVNCFSLMLDNSSLYTLIILSVHIQL